MKRTAPKKAAVPAVTATDAKPRPQDATAAQRGVDEPVRVLPGMWPNGPDV